MYATTTGSATSPSRTPSEKPSARHRTLALGIALLLGGWALESCSWFEPRSADPPEGGARIIILSEPDSVYEQIRVGLQTRSISAYMNAYGQDEFLFNPDRADSIALTTELQNPTLFDNWTYDVEQSAHSFIFGPNEGLDVVFEECDLPECQTTETVDVLNTDQFYTMTIGTGADAGTYEGITELTMLKRGGEWRIVRWIDSRRPDPQNATWGVLRGLNR